MLRVCVLAAGFALMAPGVATYCSAAGGSFATLQLKDGRVLKNVQIREVLPDGLRVAHQDGGGKIGTELLPDNVARSYGLNPANIAAYRAQDEARRRHDLNSLDQYEINRVAVVEKRETATREVLDAKIARAKAEEERRTAALLAAEEKERQRQARIAAVASIYSSPSSYSSYSSSSDSSSPSDSGAECDSTSTSSSSSSSCTSTSSPSSVSYCPETSSSSSSCTTTDTGSSSSNHHHHNNNYGNNNCGNQQSCGGVVFRTSDRPSSPAPEYPSYVDASKRVSSVPSVAPSRGKGR